MPTIPRASGGAATAAAATAASPPEAHERRGRERRLRWTAAPAEVKRADRDPGGPAAPAGPRPRAPLPERADRRRRARRLAGAARRRAAGRASSSRPVHVLVPLATRASRWRPATSTTATTWSCAAPRSTRRRCSSCSPRWRRSLGVAIGGDALEPGVLVVDVADARHRARGRAASSPARPCAPRSGRSAAWWSATRSWPRTCAARCHDSRARAEVVATLPARPRPVGRGLPRAISACSRSCSSTTSTA